MSSLHAQPNLVENFTLDDGLSSTELISVMCDEEGYLWVGFNRLPMQRYDGHTFEHVPTIADSLEDHFLDMVEDQHGLWYIGRYYIYKKENETLTAYKLSSSFTLDLHGNLALFDQQNYTYQFNPQNSKWEKTCFEPNQINANKPLSPYNLGTQYALLEDSPIAKLYLCNSMCDPFDFDRYLEHEPHILWNELYQIKKGQIEKLIDDTFQKVDLLNQKSQVFQEDITTFQNFRKFGVVLARIKSKLNDDAPQKYLELRKDDNGNIIVNSQFTHKGAIQNCTVDKNGNLWVSSHHGLKKVYSNVHSFNEHRDDLVPALHVINEDRDGNIWFGGYYTGTCFFDGHEIITNSRNGPKGVQLLPGSYRDAKGNMFFLDGKFGLMYQNQGKWQYQELLHDKLWYQRIAGYYIEPLSENKIIIGLQDHGAAIFNFENGMCVSENIISGLTEKTAHNVITVAVDNSGRIWQGHHSNNLRIYDPKTENIIVFNALKRELPGLFTISMEIDSKGRLWLGSVNGVYLIDEPHLINQEQASNPSTMDLHRIHSEKSHIGYIKEYDNHIVYGTNTGINAIALSDFVVGDTSTYRVLKINTDKAQLGGPSEQNTVYIDTKGDLWVGHDHAAFCLTTESFPKPEKTKDIRILYLKAGDHLVGNKGLEQNYRLPRNKRNVEIKISTPFTGNLNDATDFFYQLILENQSATTIKPAENGLIELEYLPPGRHTISTWSVNQNITGPARTISINVPYAYRENPQFWFIIFGSLFLIFATGFWLWYKNRLRLKEKELQLSKEQQAKERLQIQAIANSLNPHFINNSLHFIQSRVRKDGESVKVINRLAENMKSIFQKSREGKAYHSLEEEMELIYNYLAIQEARFGQSISFQITRDQLLTKYAKANIPMLQLQILIENSIEHGLRNSDRTWDLSLDISDSEEYLHFIITDNGIGRTAAKIIGSQGTQQGLKMLSTLHEIYNKHNELNINQQYVDLPYTENGERFGTSAHISIPKQFNYDF